MDDEERPHCTCQKSECIRGYCKCFHESWFCSDDCTCRDCRNVVENETEVDEIVDNIMRRKKPAAFKCKIAGDATGSMVRCNCRKSGCKKLYCECLKHQVGCSVDRCRCTCCANPYGAKHASKDDQRKVDDNVNPNELHNCSQSSSPASEVDLQKVNGNVIIPGDSQSSSPASEVVLQKVNGNVIIPGDSQSSSPASEVVLQKVNGNVIIPGDSQSSSPASEVDLQKVNGNVIIPGDSQSSSPLTSEEEKVTNDTNISYGGSSGAPDGSNVTSPLVNDEMSYWTVEKIILDDFQANPDSYYDADPDIQPFDDINFDALHQFLGYGDDFLHDIDPQTNQGSRQGSAQAGESQLNNTKSPSNIQTGSVHNASQNNTGNGDQWLRYEADQIET